MTPELVLVASPEERAAALRALPPFRPWRPTPFAYRIVRGPSIPHLLAMAALYFAAQMARKLLVAAAVTVAVILLALAVSLL